MPAANTARGVHCTIPAAAFIPVHIYVDADACPNVIKDILFRAAQRTGTPLTLVASQLDRLLAGA